MFFPLILIGTSNGILVALKKHTARLKKENADFGVHHYVLLTYCLSVDSIWPWQKKGGLHFEYHKMQNNKEKVCTYQSHFLFAIIF